MPRAILLIFLCHPLLAQSQRPPDPSTLARVEGRVTNAVSGEPLRKAEVQLHGGAGGDYTGISDGSGHFVIEQVAPGSYNLTAQHQNFATQSYGATRPGLPGTRVALSAGQQLSNLELKLVPFGVISGKVVDEDGDPVTGVSITVMKWGFVQGGRRLQPAGGGSSTNDKGEFRIYNLASGRYFLVARPVSVDRFTPVDGPAGKSAVAQRERVREGYSMTFYPSAPDVTAASAIAVSAGQEASGMDIQLHKTRIFTVEGRVAGFQRGHRVSISIQPQDTSSSMPFGMGRAASIRQENGDFTFRGVNAGQYTLIAMVNNHVGAHQEISVGDADLTGIVVTLSEPGNIKGRVLFDGGTTAKPPVLKGLRVSLPPVDTIPMNNPNANTADDGSFSMEEVPADRFKVNCSPIESAYLKTIRWNGQVANDGTVEMTGGGTATLELVFAPTSAEIDGDVKMGDDPAPGATVLLVPASRRESDFRFLMADQNGHFSAKGVAPGGYTALALDTAIFGMPDPALLKALEKFSTSATVDQSGQTTVSLKLIPEAEIEAVQ